MTKQLHCSLLLMFCLWLSACDQLDLTPKPSTPTKTSNDLVELNTDNIDTFTIEFAQTYLNTLNDLLVAFKKYNNPDSSYQFVQFRNNQWTPQYIKNKNHYQAILQNNASFLKQSTTQPLFDHFEGLIYIGLDLKKGLLDNKPALIKQALKKAKRDRLQVNAILEQAQSND